MIAYSELVYSVSYSVFPFCLQRCYVASGVRSCIIDFLVELVDELSFALCE